MRKTVAAALAALTIVAAPATAARAEVTVLTEQGVPVSLAEVGIRYTSRLGDANPDVVTLDDGSLGEIWRFDGDRGDCVSVSLQAEDFDPMLVLRYGAPFGEQMGLDDDGGSGLDAQLEGRLPRSGRYYVTVTASGAGFQEGRYSLALRSC